MPSLPVSRAMSTTQLPMSLLYVLCWHSRRKLSRIVLLFPLNGAENKSLEKRINDRVECVYTCMFPFQNTNSDTFSETISSTVPFHNTELVIWPRELDVQLESRELSRRFDGTDGRGPSTLFAADVKNTPFTRSVPR